ncbi:MAG: M48 family metalloprotease [Gammaproteobacteria bacterium]|nr:M48 family metalloprotease [Gammaproteobacteria bacterium]MDH3953601.1 M48 family metalloprotease [Gammaproteobacteria bacterium]NCF59263.1 M48 family metalloprotease [Gammaproteobacteria bacterium]
MTVALLLLTSGAGADDIKLPDMGSPADTALSKSDEAQLGRAIMAQIRLSGRVVEDPLVTEYINEVGSRIAAHANDGSQSFKFFVIDDPNINAFALPGGFIGVHTGLLEATRNEDELAGVLAHEVAHVTQRHIARAIHASQRQSIMTTALMLGAILAGVVTGDANAAQAGIVVAQGTAVQQQINFTRSNEYEADRIGIRAMDDAGFDPHGMASFFEVMSRQSPADLDMRLPEFLRTHPVTTQRIAEARNRARGYPRRPSSDSVNYGIARARMKVESFDTEEGAIVYFESRDYEQQNDIEKYGRAVAYQRAGRYRDASRIFEELLERNQKVIAYHIGAGETRLALEQPDRALATFERAVSLFPRNVPLVIHYGEGLLKLGQADKAHRILLDLMNNVPPTPEQVRLIARAANEAGDTAEALYYLSEYHLMTGNLVGGISFLQRALALPELQEIQRIRFEARIDFIREYMSEEQLKQLQRSQPVGASARNSG